MIAAVATLAACSAWQHASPSSTGCPQGTEEIDAAGERYCLGTCEGALEDNVRFSGVDYIDRFDDGPLYKLRGGLASTTKPPDDLCRSLPHGCACTTPACTYGRRQIAATNPFEPNTPPRCLEQDPSCGPEAFAGSCVGTIGYHRGVHRRPVYPSYSTRPFVRDECSYDGECVASGWGPACVSVHKIQPDVSYIGGADPEPLQQALCGCVHNACELFEVDDNAAD